MDWIIKQFTDLNVLAIIIIFTFVTAMSKMNTQKLLMKQSEEFNKKIDEVKIEMKGENQALSRMIELILSRKSK
jgi:hypothetical protein